MINSSLKNQGNKYAKKKKKKIKKKNNGFAKIASLTTRSLSSALSNYKKKKE